MSEERIALYQATVERLQRQVVALRRTRQRLPRVALGILLLAIPAYFVHPAAALFFVVTSASAYGVGHYIAMIHVTEDTHAIEIAQATLDSLRREVGDVREPEGGRDIGGDVSPSGAKTR